MRGLRIHQTIFVGLLGIVFAFMAIEANGFRELARWFPLWFALLGVILSLVGVISGGFSIVRASGIRRRLARGEVTVGSLPPLKDGSDPVKVAVDRLDQASVDSWTLLKGLRWFSLILGYVLAIRLLPFEVASIGFLLMWFNLIYRWSVRKQVITVAGLLAMLWVAENVLGMQLP